MNMLSSAVKKTLDFFGYKNPKIKMSYDGEVSLRIGSDIAVVVFIANYLIPKYQDFDFSISLNRFTRRELGTETIIEKTGVVGYQIVAKKKYKQSANEEYVFCFVLMGRKNKEVWLRENLGLKRTKNDADPQPNVLHFVPIAISEFFAEDDEVLKTTPFKEGDFPFELLSVVL